MDLNADLLDGDQALPDSTNESEIEDLIAELCLNAPTDPVKFCLRKYKYGKSVQDIENDMFKERHETLKTTASFLRVPNFNDKNKRPLSHLIVCKIQNLLPDICSLCDRKYRISLEEDPILDCAICGQAVHKPCWLNLATGSSSSDTTDITDTIDADIFKSLYNPLNLPGLFYVCHACQPKTIPSDSEGDNKRKRKHGSSVKVAASAQKNNPTQENTIQNQNNTASLAQDEDIENNRTGADNLNTKSAKGDQEKNKMICRFYKNGSCKHGLKGRDCKFLHPRMCRKFTQHGTNNKRGCTMGKKCTDFHPKMCFDSIQKGECFSEDCRFAHVKGTKRHPPSIRNNVTHENELFTNNEIPKKHAEPDFLEVVRLLREEILGTLNQKIDSMQNQLQHLQQTYKSPLPTQYPIQPIPIPRPLQSLPLQNQFNPIFRQ